MLKYAKEILAKVSFDARLFEKELRKALKMLVPVEIIELRRWCYEKFAHIYEPLLDRCFQQVKVVNE